MSGQGSEIGPGPDHVLPTRGASSGEQRKRRQGRQGGVDSAGAALPSERRDEGRRDDGRPVCAVGLPGVVPVPDRRRGGAGGRRIPARQDAVHGGGRCGADHGGSDLHAREGGDGAAGRGSDRGSAASRSSWRRSRASGPPAAPGSGLAGRSRGNASAAQGVSMVSSARSPASRTTTTRWMSSSSRST